MCVEVVRWNIISIYYALSHLQEKGAGLFFLKSVVVSKREHETLKPQRNSIDSILNCKSFISLLKISNFTPILAILFIVTPCLVKNF